MTKNTLTEAQFARLWNNHKIPTNAIAAYLGVSRAAVSWRARNRGLPARTKLRKTKVSQDDRPLLRHLWMSGVATAEIAAHFGLKSHGCTSAIARKMGLPIRVKGGSGGAGGWPRNTPIAVALAAWVDADNKLLAAMKADAARTNIKAAA